FELKKMPGAIWLRGGSIALAPGRISFTKVLSIPLDQTGNMVVNGTILTQYSPSPRLSRNGAGERHTGQEGQSGPAQFRDFSLEIHQLASDKWLPLMVNPDQISVVGPIGGRLVANSKTGSEFPIIVGKLTLDHGTVQPGFLRN